MTTLRELLRESVPTGLRTPVEVRANRWGSAPAPVAAAMAVAAAESLRNVDRHSAASRAQVVLRGGSGWAKVSIVDDGIGFDPANGLGIGLTESVLARMEEVGGSAAVDSMPGAGTTVHLVWPGTGVDRVRDLREGIQHFHKFAWPVFAPFLLLNSYLIARGLGHAARPVATLGLGLGLSLLATWALAQLLRSPIAVTRVVTVAAPAGYGLLLITVGHGPRSGSWETSAVLASVQVLAMILAWPRLALLLAMLTGVRLVAHPVVPLAATAADVAALWVYASAFWFIAEQFRRTGRDARAAELQITDAATRVRHEEVLADRRNREYAAFNRDVLPFLRAVADGEVAPVTDPEARGMAIVLASAVRDELAAMGMLTVTSRSALQRARERGVRVTLLSEVEDYAAYAGTFDALIEQVLDGLPAGAIVSATFHLSPPAVDFVVEPALATRLTGHDGWVLDVEELADATVIRAERQGRA